MFAHRDDVPRKAHERGPLRSGRQRLGAAARPPTAGIAHDVEPRSGGLTVPAYSAREQNDICCYPDSQKISFIGVGLLAGVEQLDHRDGEG
jgi:hypothetical protein